MSGLSLTLSEELLQQIAHRVAELVRDDTNGTPDDGYIDVASAAEFLACPPQSHLQPCECEADSAPSRRLEVALRPQRASRLRPERGRKAPMTKEAKYA